MPSRNDIRISDRRDKVAALFRGGTESQRKIAAALGVSQPTIKRDLDALRDEWRESARTDVAAEIGLDLSRLNQMLASVWPQVLRGDVKAVNVALSILKQRAAIYGYSAPMRITGSDGVSPVEVNHTHTLHDFSRYTSEEATALYELAARYDSGELPR